MPRPPPTTTTPPPPGSPGPRRASVGPPPRPPMRSPISPPNGAGRLAAVRRSGGGTTSESTAASRAAFRPDGLHGEGEGCAVLFLFRFVQIIFRFVQIIFRRQRIFSSGPAHPPRRQRTRLFAFSLFRLSPAPISRDSCFSCFEFPRIPACKRKQPHLPPPPPPPPFLPPSVLSLFSPQQR